MVGASGEATDDIDGDPQGDRSSTPGEVISDHGHVALQSSPPYARMIRSTPYGSREMFFVQSHITVESDSSLADIAGRSSRALDIPDMALDQSGRHEGVPVYVSSCFGLFFEVGRTEEDPPLTHQLDISSDVDRFDYDGSENEVDATRYVLILLGRAGIKASARDPGLLY